jgi:hypothetical protein
LKQRLKQEFPKEYQAAQLRQVLLELKLFYLSKTDAFCWMLVPEIDFCKGVLEAWGENPEEWELQELQELELPAHLSSLPQEPAYFGPSQTWMTL